MPACTHFFTSAEPAQFRKLLMSDNSIWLAQMNPCTDIHAPPMYDPAAHQPRPQSDPT